jgi:osmotically-inducible protein OsmY
VHGTKFPPDEELKRDVKRALHEDPFFYDEHVTVTVEKGIVHLEGIVLDPGDIRDVMRIIKKKFPGVKRVINELEVCREDSDDG